MSGNFVMSSLMMLRRVRHPQLTLLSLDILDNARIHAAWLRFVHDRNRRVKLQLTRRSAWAMLLRPWCARSSPRFCTRCAEYVDNLNLTTVQDGYIVATRASMQDALVRSVLEIDRSWNQPRLLCLARDHNLQICCPLRGSHIGYYNWERPTS